MTTPKGIHVESRPWAWQTVRGNRRKVWLTPDPVVVAFIEELKAAQARKVYDLGCGLGRHTVLLAREGFDVSGTDLSARGLLHTSRWLRKEGLGATLHPSDITVAPFPSDYFDAVIAYNVVYHGTVNSVETCLHEVKRVLRSGGRLLVTFNSTTSSDFGGGVKIDDHTFKKVGPPEDGIPHYFVDRPELERLLEGFTLDRVEHLEADEPVAGGGVKHAAHWMVWAHKA